MLAIDGNSHIEIVLVTIYRNSWNLLSAIWTFLNDLASIRTSRCATMYRTSGQRFLHYVVYANCDQRRNKWLGHTENDPGSRGFVKRAKGKQLLDCPRYNKPVPYSTSILIKRFVLWVSSCHYRWGFSNKMISSGWRILYNYLWVRMENQAHASLTGVQEQQQSSFI